MAIKYRIQERIRAMNTLDALSTLVAPRLSELRRTLYGGRGGKYDELQYLRQQDGVARGENEKLSDERIEYSGKSKRFTQAERETFEKSSSQ